MIVRECIYQNADKAGEIVPSVFRLEPKEKEAIRMYLLCSLGIKDNGSNYPGFGLLLERACGMAECGESDAITGLVRDELRLSGGLAKIDSGLMPFGRFHGWHFKTIVERWTDHLDKFFEFLRDSNKGRGNEAEQLNAIRMLNAEAVRIAAALKRELDNR